MARSSTATRKRILESAYTLFHRKGFNRVGVGEIATSAGVTKRSLYYHFRSKDDLLAVVLEEQHTLALARLAWVHRISSSADELVETMFADLARWSAKPRYAGAGFTRVVIELADLPGHPGRAIARRHKAMAEAFIAERFAEAKVSMPLERAREIYLLLEGATTLILVHGDVRYAIAAGEAAKTLIRQSSPTPRPRRRLTREESKAGAPMRSRS